LIKHNGEYIYIYVITLPDEYIRFVWPWSIRVIQWFNII
jgi:hypothetical protein